MNPISKNPKKSNDRATSEPPIGSDQPMGTSTPGDKTPMTTMPNRKSPPEVEENAKSSSSSPSSSVPAPAPALTVELAPAPTLAVVPPTRGTIDVANSSLVQRVPKSFGQISGRRQVHSQSEHGDRYCKARSKEHVPKPKNDTPKPKADAHFIFISTSAEARRHHSKGRPKEHASKRKRLPESNSETPPSQRVKHHYIDLGDASSLGYVVLNLDQLQQHIPIVEPRPLNPAENMVRIPIGTGETTDQENEDQNQENDSLPEKKPPKTNKCLIM